MENDAADARRALEVVEATKQVNAERLRRPRRYWVMVGLMLSVFALRPYLSAWPGLLQYIVPVLAVLAIAAVAAWKQPTAVRKIRLSARMAWQLAGFAVLAGILGGVSHAVYAEQGWWWVPAVAALVMFLIVVTIGPMMDRSWARQVSGI